MCSRMSPRKPCSVFFTGAPGFVAGRRVHCRTKCRPGSRLCPSYEEPREMTPLQALRLAMADVDAYYKERGIFQGKFGFGQKPALVVIDMAYGWTDPAYAGGSARLDGAIDAIARLLPVAREKGVPVYYTTSAIDRVQPKS